MVMATDTLLMNFHLKQLNNLILKLDGYGDNIFGNNSDECPNEPGNSTLDRLG